MGMLISGKFRDPAIFDCVLQCMTLLECDMQRLEASSESATKGLVENRESILIHSGKQYFAVASEIDAKNGM